MVCILAKDPVIAKSPAYHDRPPQRLLQNLSNATVNIRLGLGNLCKSQRQ